MTSVAAVIDIGSNSIRYLQAAVTPERVAAVFPKRLITTRLAEGILENGTLSEAAIARTLHAISLFCNISREKSTPLFAYATSAVRDAKNGPEFCAQVEAAFGLRVDVLPGPEEARLAYRGAVQGMGGGLIDIGGGSAQVMTEAIAKSWPIGCVRALELCRGLNAGQIPPAIAAWVGSTCAGLEEFRAHAWTGVGGTITTLAALQLNLTSYDPAAVSREALTPAGLETLLRRLAGMGEAGKAHPLLRERYDILPFGALVLQELMRRLSITALSVSDADGMEGYLMEKLTKNARTKDPGVPPPDPR